MALTVLAASSSNCMSLILLSASVLRAVFCNSTSSRAREACCSRSLANWANASLHCSYSNSVTSNIIIKIFHPNLGSVFNDMC